MQPNFRFIDAGIPFRPAPGPDVVSVYADSGPFRRWLPPMINSNNTQTPTSPPGSTTLSSLPCARMTPPPPLGLWGPVPACSVSTRAPSSPPAASGSRALTLRHAPWRPRPASRPRPPILAAAHPSCSPGCRRRRGWPAAEAMTARCTARHARLRAPPCTASCRTGPARPAQCGCSNSREPPRAAQVGAREAVSG